MGEKGGEQIACVAKLTEATRAGSSALIAPSCLALTLQSIQV